MINNNNKSLVFINANLNKTMLIYINQIDIFFSLIH